MGTRRLGEPLATAADDARRWTVDEVMADEQDRQPANNRNSDGDATFLGDEAAALSQLPDLSPGAGEVAAATGTDDADTNGGRTSGDPKWGAKWGAAGCTEPPRPWTHMDVAPDRDDAPEDDQPVADQEVSNDREGNGGGRIRTYVGIIQQIYSLPRLAASVHPHWVGGPF